MLIRLQWFPLSEQGFQNGNYNDYLQDSGMNNIVIAPRPLFPFHAALEGRLVASSG